MRVPRSSSASLASTLVAWLVPLVAGISVPTGKLTPISPARQVAPTVNPQAPSQPAPVQEYSRDHPEPPPLHPSYVPFAYDYFNTLVKHHLVYVPARYRNFNSISNEVGYEPPKYYPGLPLGKNIDYKPYTPHQYFPVNWSNQQYNQPANQVGNQYNDQYNNVDSNQYNEVDSNQYNSVNSNQFVRQITHQYSVQPTQQQPLPQQPQQQQPQQQREVVTTQAAPASTAAPPPPPSPAAPGAKEYRKVDYSIGKGSYDVTGKGGSRSEYYSQDWSKKTVYPKKTSSQSLTHRKYSDKY